MVRNYIFKNRGLDYLNWVLPLLREKMEIIIIMIDFS